MKILESLKIKQEGIRKNSEENFIKETNEIQKEKEQKIASIERGYKRKYEPERKKRLDEVSKENEEYFGRAAARIMEDIDKSSEILTARSSVVGVGEELLNQAKNVYGVLKKIGDETQKNILINSLDSFKINKITPLFKNNSSEEADITSFISEDDKDQCYLLCPINETKKSTLMGNLEETLMEVLALGEIVLGTDTEITNGVVGNAQLRKINFTADMSNSNNALLYTLKTSINPKILLERLRKKLTDKNIQPDNFKETGLKHSVYAVEMGIIDYFMKHNIGELSLILENEILKKSGRNIPIEDAARISGRKILGLRVLISKGIIEGSRDYVDSESFEKYLRKIGKLSKENQKLEESERRQLAIQKLCGMGEIIRINDIQEALDYKSYTSAYSFAIRLPKDLVFKSGGKFLIKNDNQLKNYLKKYIFHNKK